MSIRPWVVVEAPDSRGLRRVTVGGEHIGSAWSPGELRRLLDRHGHPDVDLEDPASVCWRGGDSGTWPDRAWRRRAVLVLMVVGLLASGLLDAVIGWPDASAALTFAQRVTGALLVLSGVVQGAAAIAALDYWGRRHSRTSGALVLLGVLLSLATDSLLVLMWLEEREYTPYMLAFLPLWCWSLWALRLLVRARSWKGVPQPRKYAAGLFTSALVTAVSLAYSTVYQPAVAPMRFTLKAAFGTARADRERPFVQVPLQLSVRNTGDVAVYVIVNDFSVYGRTAAYSETGNSVEEQWKRSIDENAEEDAERHVDRLQYSLLSSGRFYDPGTVLDSGQEDTRQHVFQLPANAAYDLLRVDLQMTYMRKDRGRIDVRTFGKAHVSWGRGNGRYSCVLLRCADQFVYHARVRHNNNLVNVTRSPRYVTAVWSPELSPVYSVSSYHLRGRGVDPAEETRDVNRFGIGEVHAYSEVSAAELLGSMPSPRPSRPTSPR
ncbi:hypothetical protein [Streptomyces sp. NPDC006193]|uniref:hypothetical protein n=1 Tax=Streptomyces sp. NPDC006193 TaxID=3155717 RepID=UPI0033B55F82